MVLRFSDVRYGRDAHIRPVRFANGEETYRADGAYAGQRIVIQCSEDMDNDDFYSLLQLIDCIRTFAVPYVYMPYFFGGRQHRDSQADYATISAKLNETLLYAAGAEQVYTIDLHDPKATPGVMNLMPHMFLAQHLRRHGKEFDIVVAPDHGALKRAEYLALLLGAKAITYKKFRDGKNVTVKPDKRLFSLKGKRCIVVDDIIDSGATMLKVIEDIKDRGGIVDTVFATHCVAKNADVSFSAKGITVVGVTGFPGEVLEGRRQTELYENFVAKLIDEEVSTYD